jgi:hypothetical protein
MMVDSPVLLSEKELGMSDDDLRDRIIKKGYCVMLNERTPPGGMLEACYRFSCPVYTQCRKNDRGCPVPPAIKEVTE